MNHPEIITTEQACKLFTVNQLVDALVKMDYATINIENEEDEGTIEQWSDILRHNPDAFRYLLNGNELIGYWHYVFLNEETFDKAKKGLLLEGEITTDMLISPDSPGEYDGYFLCLTIAQEHRTARNLMRLFQAFARQMEEYAEKGIFVREWCTNAYSEEGETMCKVMKHAFLCNNISSGRMYGSPFRPSPEMSVFRFHDKLISLYREYFRY